MSYTDAINYLYNLQKHGIKLGLEKPKKILSAIGNPHKEFRSIHVAGTNGKGSVSAMISSILISHGFKVGLFTSPHLVSFTERIKINNKDISESDVIKLTEEIRSVIQDKDEIPDPTFFEFVTAMAFLYFSRNSVDWAVIETGMGGRLDATNVLLPDVSVITNINYDHKEFLGHTLKAIAKEKAGIIKNGIPVVSAMQEEEAEEIIKKTAKEKSSDIYIYGMDFKGKLVSSDINGLIFDYTDESHVIKNIRTPLAGEHQLSNACLAIKASMITLKRAQLPDFSISDLKRGLASTKWHGRLEIVSKNPMILIDGAHNPDAASVLSRFIKKHLIDYRIILVIGVMSDKDIKGILSPLIPLASEIIFTAPDYGRSASPIRLSEIASQMGYASKTTNSVKEALNMAKELCASYKNPKNPPLILLTGSFYTIGEALESLGKKPTLSALREAV